MASKSLQHAKVIARAMQDPDFKKRLIKNPHAVLAAEGVAVKEGVKLKVVENTASVHHVVIPAAPKRPVAATKLSKHKMGASFTCA
jgi:hypothetical protein